MPFHDILVTVPGNAKHTSATISYRRNRRSKNRNMPNLLIGIPRMIAGDTVKVGEKFKILLGDGADVGKARIVRSDNGSGVTASVMRGAVTFRFGHVPMLGPDAADKEELEVTLVDGGFELTLPKWFSARA